MRRAIFVLTVLFISAMGVMAGEKNGKKPEDKEVTTIEVDVLPAHTYTVGRGNAWENSFYESKGIPQGATGVLRAINFTIVPPRKGKKALKNISVIRAITIISDNRPEIRIPPSPSEIETGLDKGGRCSSQFGLLANQKEKNPFPLEYRRVERDEFYLVENGEKRSFAVFDIEFLPGMGEINVTMVSPNRGYVGTRSRIQFLISM